MSDRHAAELAPRRWSLAAAYSDVDVELAGDPASLAGLEDCIQHLSDPFRIGLIAREVPGRRGLRTLVLQVGAGPIVIRHDRETLVVEGDRESLRTFGTNVAWFVANENQTDPLAHLHLEYVAAPGWPIAKVAVPLLLRFLSP